MTRMVNIVHKIRSKNAGPFWLTIDIFCDDELSFSFVRDHLQTVRVAALFKTSESLIRRFDIPQLLVIKISLPRPQIQGTVTDTDMHGASFAVLLEELELGSSD